MSFNSRKKTNVYAKTATALTGATGTTVAGTTMPCGASNLGPKPGTSILAKVTVVIQTASVTVTPKWQVSDDDSNWYDLYAMNDAANVAISASDTRYVSLCAKPPMQFIRVIGLVGGATATAGDTIAISYTYEADDYN